MFVLYCYYFDKKENDPWGNPGMAIAHHDPS